MGTGLAYGLSGLLGLAQGLMNARKQSREDALFEAELNKGQGTWEAVPDVQRSWLAKLLSAGMPSGTLEASPGHTYAFTPYGKTTPEDLISMGLTTPVPHAMLAPPPGGGFAPPPLGVGSASPMARGTPWSMPETPQEQAGFQPTTTTREEPIKAFLNIPKTPEFQSKALENVLTGRRQLELQRLKRAEDEADNQAFLKTYQALGGSQLLQTPPRTPDAPAVPVPPPQAPAAPRPGGTPGTPPRTGDQTVTWSNVQPSPAVFAAAQRASKARGVPVAQLLGLGAVESLFDPNATGPMTRFGWQAKGYGQLSPDTGDRFGVKDPYNLDQNMQGTARAWQEAMQKAGGDPRVAYQKYYNPGASNALTDKVIQSIERFQRAPGAAAGAPAAPTTPPLPATSPQAPAATGGTLSAQITDIDTRIAATRALLASQKKLPPNRVATLQGLIADLEKQRADLEKPGEKARETEATQSVKFPNDEFQTAFIQLKGEKALPQDLTWGTATTDQRALVAQRVQGNQVEQEVRKSGQVVDRQTQREDAQAQRLETIYTQVRDELTVAQDTAQPPASRKAALDRAENLLGANKVVRNRWPQDIQDTLGQQRAMHTVLRGDERFFVDPKDFHVYPLNTKAQAEEQGLVAVPREARTMLQELNILMTRFQAIERLLTKEYGATGLLSDIRDTGSTLDNVATRTRGGARVLVNKQSQLSKEMRSLQADIGTISINLARIMGERGHSIVALINRAAGELPNVTPGFTHPQVDLREQAYNSMANVRHYMERAYRELVPQADAINPTPHPEELQRRLEAQELAQAQGPPASVPQGQASQPPAAPRAGTGAQTLEDKVNAMTPEQRQQRRDELLRKQRGA
jgi:hypothetical protein